MQTHSGLCLAIMKLHASEGCLRRASCMIALVAVLHPCLVCPHAGKCVKTIMDDTNPPLGYARFAPNGRYIMTCSLDSRIKLWDFDALKLLKTYDGETPSATAVAKDDAFATVSVEEERSGVIATVE